MKHSGNTIFLVGMTGFILVISTETEDMSAMLICGLLALAGLGLAWLGYRIETVRAERRAKQIARTIAREMRHGDTILGDQ